ncbi:MAG TPA: FAD-dependent oxidoreductase [Devosia sp.]|jgi:sarcosine oxidase subunit alpha|uniref:FAD-dependent oxidoreductase n=1 Tax=Devosia sp. TaxID=1871048 RepID=UPI002F93F4AC
MSSRSARLASGEKHPFHGQVLDRQKPIKFQLDGRTFSAFSGDTVLSAVLASGVDTAGKLHNHPVALTSSHAPSIVAANHANDPHHALAMERTLVSDGAEYLTWGHRPVSLGLGALMRQRGRSLGIDLASSKAMSKPWLGLPAAQEMQADLAVIGGGVAGMSAALAAAARGLGVLLVEAQPQLGGSSRLFGRLDGEATPDEAIDLLRLQIEQAPSVTVLTSAEVYALQKGKLRLHAVGLEDAKPSIVDVSARHMVVATGALERLPVFPGNRLPGVVGALEAFELAYHYGVWPTGPAIVATSSSPAYRLAMLARDAGAAVARILDSRLAPQSRFIEFAKAYGITMAAGTVVGSAGAAAKGAALSVSPRLSTEGLPSHEPPLTVDRLVVCGGWQPELTLWHIAGGESRWNAELSRLEPGGVVEGIALAGSAAGWLTRSACLASGRSAVAQLLGEKPIAVQESLIDPIYDTPDGPAPVGEAPQEGGPSAFLDGSRAYLVRPFAAVKTRPGWLQFNSPPPVWSLADTPHPLELSAIAAGVQLGAIPAESAGIVARERVQVVPLGGAASAALDKPQTPFPPAYLGGRYPGAELLVANPVEPRRLNVGALVYATADESNPLHAIGVIIRSQGEVAVALVNGTPGATVFCREPGRAVAIRLVTAYRDGMDLAAALGSGAGAP